MSEPSRIHGLLAEFENPGRLIEASRKVRDAGYRNWDTYSPFPVHGIESAMGLRDSRLPWITFFAGATGLGVAILMQWWMNAIDYPIVISGKPLFSLPANIPVAFELTVLFASLATFLGMLGLNKLPQFYHPVFKSERFRRVTTDAFFIAVEAIDPRFDLEETEEFLGSLGPVRVERLED